MNRLANNITTNLWSFSGEIWTKNWLQKARKLNQKLFTKNTGYPESITEIIVQLREIFEQMIDDVNTENRRSYCQAILDYCELTQDWREWGNWIQQEIEQGVGEDAPWLYYGWGRYLEEIGQFQKSIDCHKTGIFASEKSENKMFLACNHLGAGIALQRYNKPDDAEYHILRSLELFKKLNHLYFQAQTLANLGSLYDRFNKSKRAIFVYQESASILQKLGNYFDLGRILYSLGIAHLNLDQLSQAESAFSEAKQLCESTENWYFLALNFYGIGWLEYKKGKFEVSQNYLEKSLHQLNKAVQLGGRVSQLSFPEIEGNIYILAAASYSRGSQPNFEASETYLKKAEMAYNRLDYAEKKLLNVLANRARLYEFKENWSEAIFYFLELLKEGKRLNSMKTIQDAATHLVRIYWKKSTSFLDWIELLEKLGFLGIVSLVRRFKSRIFRS